MKAIFFAAAAAVLAGPALAEPITEYSMRDEGGVPPGLQYTVSGRDGATVTVIEGQPRWSSQRRTDSRLVPGGVDVSNVTTIIERRHHRPINAW